MWLQRFLGRVFEVFAYEAIDGSFTTGIFVINLAGDAQGERVRSRSSGILHCVVGRSLFPQKSIEGEGATQEQCP